MSLDSVANKLQQKQSETIRLLDMLKYYRWLETQELSWDKIQSIGEVSAENPTWINMIPEHLPRPAKYHTHTKLISYRLKDGTQAVRLWPPFADDVIFNQTRI